MTCSKCKHSREIARLADFPDERERARLRDICSKCTLSEKLPGDGSVSLDNILDGTADRIAKVAPNHKTSYTYDPGEIDEPQEPDAKTQTRDTLQTLLACVAALPYEQLTRLVQIADTFRTLTRRQFEIVAHLLNGGTVTDYAKANGLSKQTASARMKALFKAHPVFQSISRGKCGKVSKVQKYLKNAKILKSERG